MRHLFTILVALVINDAGMEYDPSYPPTVPQVLACGWDNARFCGQYLGEARAILHVCMQAHERQLSPRCRKAFK